jgi:hypothetical protein
VTYTRRRIDTINSPDDGHMAARNMYRIEINKHEKETVSQVGYLLGLHVLCFYMYLCKAVWNAGAQPVRLLA